MLVRQAGASPVFPHEPERYPECALAGRPRIDNDGTGGKLEALLMRFAGIDVASQIHAIAIVTESGEVLVKPTPFTEDAAGYEKLFTALGAPNDILVAMEATGHYGRNLVLALTEQSFPVAVLNPIRTKRFAQEDLRRAKTDSIDAIGIARFAAQKRPPSTPPLDEQTDELRELVRLFDRLTQDHGDRRRQLHRLLDLGFPEFTRHVRSLSSQRATAILTAYPTAAAFSEASPQSLAAIGHDRRLTLGRTFALNLIEAAKTSVGKHHGHAYRTAVRYLCRDLDQLRITLQELRSDITSRVDQHQVGSLLITIDGLGALGAARIIAAVGDPARFRNGAALAAYVGVVPGTRKSGLRQGNRDPLSPLGNARLRRALYMTTLGAVSRNAWLAAYYERLKANGKLPKVALVAAMRKLLTAVYSVAKHKQPFVPRLR